MKLYCFRWRIRWCLMLNVSFCIIHQPQRKHTTTEQSLRGPSLRYLHINHNFSHIINHFDPETNWTSYLPLFDYKQNSASLAVPGGPSVACSTAKAIEWDASWSKNLDPSGRAAVGVHNSAYEEHLTSVGNGNLAPEIIDNVPCMVGVPAKELIIQS